MDMLKVCAAHGESVSDVYWVCHLLFGDIPIFSACSQPNEMVKQWFHLGDIILHDMDDPYHSVLLP